LAETPLDYYRNTPIELLNWYWDLVIATEYVWRVHNLWDVEMLTVAVRDLAADCERVNYWQYQIYSTFVVPCIAAICM
jgi:hypothetical protein